MSDDDIRAESHYRFEERLGILYGSQPTTPAHRRELQTEVTRDTAAAFKVQNEFDL